jgi:hypothetical protein
MNDLDKYLFDLQGFVTVPNALDAGQLQTLNTIWDEHIARDVAADAQNQRWGRIVHWGKPYLDLIDNPRIAPFLDEIVGERFRLDHDYADLIRSGLSPIGATLHGGATPFDPSQYYRFQDGRMHNGLIVVAYNLHDVNLGDGGFGCVPGSHKSNYAYPEAYRSLEDFQPFMRAVTGPAGTAIIFTEALTHGAMPWRGARERRTLFFKYSPHPLSWAASYYDEPFDGVTERQREILEAPNARYKGRKR